MFRNAVQFEQVFFRIGFAKKGNYSTFAPLILIIMKKEIHPQNYRMVVFKDISCDYAFVTRSTIETKDSIKWTDGKDYPLVKLEISHMSHPYYTGKMKLIDTAGRVDKFRTRYSKKKDVKGSESKVD